MALIVQDYSCPACKHPGPHPVLWQDAARIELVCGKCGRDFAVSKGAA